MSALVAGAVVFFTSGAVLVLEILAGRLLAPYVGVTLETYTAIIGTVLAGIATGTWMGGSVADRVAPRRVIGPLLVAGGILCVAVVPLARLVGEAFASDDPGAAVVLAAVLFFAPAAVLSAVSPAVAKHQLQDLRNTGRVVGRLSALGTAGAIAGTFFAGFFLVGVASTSTSIVAVGAALVAGGVAAWVRLSGMGRRAVSGTLALTVMVGGSVFAVGETCDVDTVYHCARVLPDPARQSGRLLMLDTLRHSYVDVADPAHLEFRYTKVVADVVAAAAPAGPLRALHIGGGGFTMPRYWRETRPGSTNTVVEIDGTLVDLVRDRLALVDDPGIDVRVGDARLVVPTLPAGAFDVAVGDAFGGLAVPWHLTTVEFARAVERVLAPGGVYVMNVIDYPPLRFARAEVATLAAVFEHVAVIAPPEMAEGAAGGNVILAAGNAPLATARLSELVAARGGTEQVAAGAAVHRFAGAARPLTDEFAPVDQWLARARASSG